MATHEFFDRQTAMDIEGIDTDILHVLSTEAELVKQELEAYRIEVAQLKQQQQELWQDEQTAEYELTSVFIHRGSSPSFGHYFFYARCLPDRPDEWFKYNDSDVSLVSKDEVLADTTGSTANPYLVSSQVLPSTGVLSSCMY
jgi:ubiquitin carboxyl-terminal hydrolase 25/28